MQETFSITAGQQTNTSVYHTGADPNNILGVGAFGSIDQGTLSTFEVVGMYTFGYTPTTGIFIVLWISALGGGLPTWNCFDSITFVDATATTRTLYRGDSTNQYGIDGPGNAYKEWVWTIVPADQRFAVGQTYSITTNVNEVAPATEWPRTHTFIPPIATWNVLTQFGRSAVMSSDGTTIVVIDPFTGAAPAGFGGGVTIQGVNTIHVFRINELGQWMQEAILRPPVSYGMMLLTITDISSDGTRFVATATDANGTSTPGTGALYVWSYLPVSPGYPDIKNWVLSQEISGDTTFDALGTTAAITADGSTIMSTAPGTSPSLSNQGSSYVYNRQPRPLSDPTRWTFKTNIGKPFRSAAFPDKWGKYVTLSKNGNYIATVGAGSNVPTTWFPEVYALHESFPVNKDELWRVAVGPTASLGEYGASMSDDLINSTVIVSSIDTSGTDHYLAIWRMGGYRYELTHKLPAPANTQFREVAISGDGNTAFVALYDTVNLVYTSIRVYVYNAGTGDWDLLETIVPPPLTYVENFGVTMSASYSGTELVVGAPSQTTADASRVYVYRWNGTSMSEEFDGTASSIIPCLFGQSVSINSAGNRFVVGDPINERAYLFEYNGSWTSTLAFDLQEAYSGIATQSAFGEAVGISGDGNIIVVGAPDATASGSPAPSFVNGAAVVYRLVGSTWRAEQVLFDYQTIARSRFGAGVAVNQDGSIVCVGAPDHMTASYSAPGSDTLGMVTVWTNDAYQETEAGPVQIADPTPTISLYSTKRLVNVDEPFEFKVEVTNRCKQTITNLVVSLVEQYSSGLIDVVDSVDYGTLVGLVWTIPILAPGDVWTFTRSAKQSSLYYGMTPTLYINTANSDQVPAWDLTNVNGHDAYYPTGGPINGSSTIHTTNVAVMNKMYCYTLGPTEGLGQTTWTNDGTLLLTPGSGGARYYGAYTATNTTNPGSYCVDQYLGRAYPYYSTLKPIVAPNGKYIVFPQLQEDVGFVGEPETQPTELVITKRDLVGTIKRVDHVFENPNDTPYNRPNNIAISPDADATYMAYCGAAPGGFRVYKKDPAAFKWTLLPTLPGAPDGEPMYATWSDDSQYLAVACRSSTRSWYIWKLDSLTDTWTDLSFVGRLNGTNEYGVAKFSRQTNGRYVLFIGPSWDVNRFEIRNTSVPNYGDVDPASNVIYVGGYWNNGDVVRYSKEGAPGTLGLIDNTNYYVRKTYTGEAGQHFAIYPTRADSLADTNRLDLLSLTSAYYHYFHTGYEGAIEGKGGGSFMYLLNPADDTITTLGGLKCLKDLQTHADYTGRFTGGSGYTSNTIVYMQEGTRVRITAVSSGAVTSFSIDKWNASKRGHSPGATISDSAGGGFSITPNSSNEIPHCTGGAMTDAAWSDQYLVIGRTAVGIPWTTNEDSAYLEIFERSGTYGEILNMFTGTVMDDPMYPGSDGYPVPVIPKWATQKGPEVTNASLTYVSTQNRINFPSGTTNYNIGDVVALKSSTGTIYDVGMYTIIGKAATYVIVSYLVDHVPYSSNSWVYGATNCTASVLTNSDRSACSAPRTIEFNHDGTFLVIGGSSWTYGEPMHYPYANTKYTNGRVPSTVYKVTPASSAATFQRLKDEYHYEDSNTGVPDTNNAKQLYWWKRFNQWIGVWPGYMSGSYYNATDWSVDDQVPVDPQLSLTYGQAFWDQYFHQSSSAQPGYINSGWLQDGTRNMGSNVEAEIAAVDGFEGAHSGFGMWKGNHNGSVAEGANDRYDTTMLNIDYTNEFFIRCWFRLDAGFTRTNTNPAKFMRIYNPDSPTHDFYLTATNTNGLSNGGTINGVSLTSYDGNATNDYSALSTSWHKLEYYVNESLGILRVWQDGVVTRNEVGLNFGSLPMSPFYLVSDFSGAHDSTNYYYFDDVQVYTDKSSGVLGLMTNATIYTTGGIYLGGTDITITSDHLTGWSSVVHGDSSDYASCVYTATQTIVSSTATSITYTPVDVGGPQIQYVFEFVLDGSGNVLHTRQLQNGNLF